MKQRIIFWLIIISNPAFAQFPPLEISADQVQTIPSNTIDVSIRAGTNWQNITEIQGTIIFDYNVVNEVQMIYWGLSNPLGAVFTDLGGGFLIFDWESLISIGPSLSQDEIVFTLQFNVIGAVGDVSPVYFSSTPELMYWENGIGWSGNNFTISDGSVSVIAPDDVIFYDGFE